MEEEKKEETVKPAKKQRRIPTLFVVLLAIIFVLMGFATGYVIGEELGKKEVKCPKQTEEKKEEEKKEEVKVDATEKMIINLYGAEGYLYYISDGDVYYLDATNIGNDRLFYLTHAACMADNSSEYCKGNPPYSKKATKVEGLSNVIKLKIFNKSGATDESFEAYALDSNGKAYTLNGTKATVVANEGFITDIVAGNDHDAKFVTK